MVSKYADKVFRDSIPIPCGKCFGCRMDYSRDWANRCILENQYHDSSYFVTLTYNDDHLPFEGHDFDIVTGEIFSQVATLRKRDFQLFMKRLRKNYKYDNNLRFFAAGEYGENSARPHYHAIIFGLKLDDLVPYKKKNGYQYYTSAFLNRCWSDSKGQIGFVVVGAVTWDTCAYTARYIMKKHKGLDAHFYKDNDLVPEFTLMSRKPGIAYQYYADHKDDIYRTDSISLSDLKKGRTIKPCRYYDKMFDIDDHERFEDIRQLRILKADSFTSQVVFRTNIPYLDYLSITERSHINRCKALKRGLESGEL